MQQPGQSDLLSGGAALVGDAGHLWMVAAQWEVRNEHDSLARAVVEHVIPVPLGQVVVALHRVDLDDRPSPFDLLDGHLRQPNSLDLSGVAVLLDDRHRVLEGSVGVGAVEVVEVDGVRLQRPQALLYLAAQDVGPTFAGAIASLSRSHQGFPLPVGERRANGSLTLATDIEVSGIDDVYARLDGSADERDMTGRKTQSIGAQADAGDLGIAESHAPRRFHRAVLNWPARHVVSRNARTSESGSLLMLSDSWRRMNSP